MADVDEQELIRRANRGEEAALSFLYTHYKEFVIKLAMGFVGNEPDALDVLQDVYTYFFGKFPGFKLTATIRAFLYPTVKHTSLRHLRKKRKVVSLEDVRENRDIQWYAANPTAARELEDVFKSLDAKQRELLQMRFGLGMKLAEIAAATDEPLGTIKSRLHNTLKVLKNSDEN